MYRIDLDLARIRVPVSPLTTGYNAPCVEYDCVPHIALHRLWAWQYAMDKSRDIFKRKLIMAQMLHLGNSHKKLAQSAYQ